MQLFLFFSRCKHSVGVLSNGICELRERDLWVCISSGIFCICQRESLLVGQLIGERASSPLSLLVNFFRTCPHLQVAKVLEARPDSRGIVSDKIDMRLRRLLADLRR